MQHDGTVTTDKVSPALLWFHGDITRDEAKNIISSYEYKHDGLFIVRYSSSSKSYVLSVHNKEQILHYQIQHTNEQFFIDNGPRFVSLTALIEHYQNTEDGLPTKLVSFCKGRLAPLDVLKRENTKLHKAASKNEYRTIKGILDNLVDINQKREVLDVKNLEGYTPLHIAVIKGNNDIVKQLIKAGASIEIDDDACNSCLYLAVMNDRIQIVKFLVKKLPLERISRISKNNDTGWSVLHEAAARDQSQILSVLLEAGLPAYPQNYDKNTPADLATSAGNKSIVTVLEKAVSAPRFAVSFTARDFMHLNIDRKAAAKMLHGAGDGTFLTRKSQRVKGVHVLSMVCGKKDFHYEINNRNDRFWFIDDGPMWDSLDNLIAYYSECSDGLITKLTKPVPITPARGTTPTPHQQQRAPLPPPETFQHIRPQQPPAPVPWRQHRQPQTCLSSLMIIPYTNLQHLKALGEGEFGVVLEGIYTKTDGSKLPVAIKTLRKDSVLAGTQDFMREAEVMHRLSHPNIVSLIGICKEPSLMLVQELVRYGALLGYLKDKRDKIALAHQMNWGAQIAFGMSYLEAQKFVHRDLAARNILVAAPDTVKISDFGLSRAIKAESATYQAHKGGKWPVKWYAPESTLFGTFSSASDVWSYGVTLWEIFTLGEMPYGEMSSQAVLEMLEQRKERLPKPGRCPDDVYHVMLKCWEFDPTLRPSFRQLHEHFVNSPQVNIPDYPAPTTVVQSGHQTPIPHPGPIYPISYPSQQMPHPSHGVPQHAQHSGGMPQQLSHSQMRQHVMQAPPSLPHLPPPPVSQHHRQTRGPLPPPQHPRR